MQPVTILAGSSQSLISDSRDSEFYHQSQRKEAVSAEIKACLDLHFGGQGKEEKQMRLAVSELIFAVKSKEAANQITEVMREYNEGQSPEWDMPF